MSISDILLLKELRQKSLDLASNIKINEPNFNTDIELPQKQYFKPPKFVEEEAGLFEEQKRNSSIYEDSKFIRELEEKINKVQSIRIKEIQSRNFKI